jgi:hypothetical protein
LACAAVFAATGYQSEIAEWRAQREAALKREGGWLSVAGLFWLHDGANRFGKDPDNDIVLPDGAPHAGVFELHDGKVTVKMAGDIRELWPDSLDVAKVGRLNLFVIKNIAPDIPLSDVIWGVMPFVGLMMVAVVVLCFAPEIAVWLPDTLITGA